MPKVAVTPEQFWAQMQELVPESWWDDADRVIREAQPLRERAKFNTGSISRTTAVALRAISAWRQPDVVVEVGTFIGVSTKTLARGTARLLHTCDISNDCLDACWPIYTWPYTKSTDMLKRLDDDLVTWRRDQQADGWKKMSVDMFFFDGLLTPEDVPLIRKLSTPETVYVFDDYNGEYKGVKNAQKLCPLLPNHVLMPAAGWVEKDTTLAVLVPESML